MSQPQPQAFVRQAGAGPTVVCLHSNASSSAQWRGLMDLLAPGHTVLAPDSYGSGKSPEWPSDSRITLGDEVRLVEHLILGAPDQPVLVGHSYGGWVISGAIEKLEKRVASIVYLDAALPPDGVSGFDLQSAADQAAAKAALARGELARPLPDPAHFEITDPADVTWVNSKMTPHPIGVAMQKVRLTGARDRVAKKTYVRALRHPSVNFDRALATCKADPSWRIHELDCGHDMMVDQPEMLARLLLECA